VEDMLSILGLEPEEPEPAQEEVWQKEVPSEGERIAGEEEERKEKGVEDYRTVELEPSTAAPGGEASAPHEEAPATEAPREDGGEEGIDGLPEVDEVHVSKIIDQFKAEVTATIDDEDFRSHYDLGMAYLEMDLLPEAIREFQLASKSSTYKVRCLEMIGLCFLKQNQPHLAIKQLEKGLALVGRDERETLGLRYNLGLAYEMMGESEKAKACFEEVYMVDVSFRDVAEKMKKYAST